jgi:hypothetical protein
MTLRSRHRVPQTEESVDEESLFMGRFLEVSTFPFCTGGLCGSPYVESQPEKF